MNNINQIKEGKKNIELKVYNSNGELIFKFLTWETFLTIVKDRRNYLIFPSLEGRFQILNFEYLHTKPDGIKVYYLQVNKI